PLENRCPGFSICLFLVMTSGRKFSSGSGTWQKQELELFLKIFLGAKVFWYKQSLGVKPTLVSTNSKFNKINSLHGEFNSNKRFTLDRETNDLQIKRVQVSDSAVYLCLTSVLHSIDILESYTVIVKSLNAQAKVYQPLYEDAEEGRSIILNCSVHTGSCGEQPRVHWFKQSEEFTAGVLYSHNGHWCEKTTDSPTNSCVYSLPIHNVSSEQTGTYYCAVAACGQVLFGNGTTVMIKGEFNFCCLFIDCILLCILNILCIFCVFLGQGFPKLLQYMATEQVTKSEGRGQRDDTWSECVYFSVEQGN
uniref:Ig-like domain-containing protein n=1 Tax=Neogobius melanostomus TaxID=47308 RepID=A0A8C6SV94_9GOBI